MAKQAPVKTVPPGKGKNKTKSRNRRRREQKRLAYLKKQGDLSSEAALDDLRLYNENGQKECDNPNRATKRPENDDGGLTDYFQTKRDELLQSISNGGVDISEAPELQERDEAGMAISQAPREPETKVQTSEPSQSISGTERFCDVEMTEANGSPPIEDRMSTLATDPHQPLKDEVVSADISRNAEVPPQTTIDNGTPVVGVPAGTIEEPSSQQRRSRLDLSGAKRMLFGSLGLRTPKTKEEEMVTRNKLMKDIKVVKKPEADNVTETLEDIAADDSWKARINLMAVECCHEGIQLSTPPFPFVQRWDPQQQRGYINTRSKKRKGKKRKRNADSYYEESFYQDSDSKVARNKDYEAPEGDLGLPDFDESAASALEQQGFHDQPFNDPAQSADKRLMPESGEASMYTLRGTDEPVPDLPSLPDDPSTCPALTRDTAKEGTIIAFKQLEMSAETNWQPNISDYRTATVDEVSNNGVLYMTPAKRDRPKKQAEYDDATGERLYSKFEMPGYDDEDDTGKLEISFDELISPILIRARHNVMSQENGGYSPANRSDAGDGDAKIHENKQDASDQRHLHHKHAFEVSTNDIIINPSKESREEISELIKDAGWRSSVQSGVYGGIIAPMNSDLPTVLMQGGLGDTALVNAPSPRFNGFNSIPPVHVRSSPPNGVTRDEDSSHAFGTEIADSVPLQISQSDHSEFKSVVSDSKSAIDYPSLPQGNDSEILQEEAQRRSDPLFDHQLPSQDLISDGMSLSPEHSSDCFTDCLKKPSLESSLAAKPPTNLDGAESEDEFPEPFSQAWESRMSQEVDIKPEFSQDDAISPPSYRKTKIIGRRASPQKESNQTWRPDGDWSTFEDDDDDASTPRPSQRQRLSQVVDLTISSDSLDAVDIQKIEDGDASHRLPQGPGWVKKTTRLGKERSGSAKARPKRPVKTKTKPR